MNDDPPRNRWRSSTLALAFLLRSALSLLLFVAVCVLSLRTLDTSLVILRASKAAAGPHSVAGVVSGRGGVGVVWVNHPVGDYDEGGWSVSRPPTQYGGVDWPQISGHSWAGFHFANTKIGREWIVGLCAPVWFILPVFLATPLLWLRHHRRRKRNRPGLCPSCGDDLRATRGDARSAAENPPWLRPNGRGEAAINVWPASRAVRADRTA